MKLVDKMKYKLTEDIYTQEEIDKILEQEKYYPVEQDEEEEDGILKYSNGKSQLWVRYTRDGNDYLVSNVTMKTKKSGSTKTRAFRDIDEIKKMLNFFKTYQMYDEVLIFVFGVFFARRIGDTLSLKWSDFYFENGRKKSNLNTLIEDKTGKTIPLSITEVAWLYIDWYCDVTNTIPMEHFHDDIFMTDLKYTISKLPEGESKLKAYGDALEKQESAFRYKFKKAANFNGIEGVSTHSLRKTFGYIVYQLNRYDPDCLFVLQSIYGHANIETTKIYIDIMDEKGAKYFGDAAKYIYDIDHGITPCIDNTPVVALKTNDLRNILMAAYSMGSEGQNGEDNGMEIMNQLLSMVEEKRVS